MKIGDKTKGVTAISIVDRPAIESNFVALAKDEKKVMMSIDEDQHIITGAVLIPNKMIYRNSDFDGGECEIFFTADTIKLASQQFLSGKNVHDTTVQHAVSTDDASIVESWLVADTQKDKSCALGLNMPVGTWMASYYVCNDQLWNSIKSGVFNGFSIEAEFEMVDLSKQDDDLTDEDLQKIIDVAKSFAK